MENKKKEKEIDYHTLQKHWQSVCTPLSLDMHYSLVYSLCKKPSFKYMLPSVSPYSLFETDKIRNFDVNSTYLSKCNHLVV